uniref:Uncharacterized protein n=1 Tax=Molossus molossus TaxID=27622 RepID=A0A7J8HHZ1_MOLMO|nr:hypothetical protein HJG59_011023 [Molossus molossus]
MAHQEDEEQFTHLFFLTVAIKGFVPFELEANVSQFLVDSLNFHLFALIVPDVGDEHREPPYPITLEHYGMMAVVQLQAWPGRTQHSRQTGRTSVVLSNLESDYFTNYYSTEPYILLTTGVEIPWTMFIPLASLYLAQTHSLAT